RRCASACRVAGGNAERTARMARRASRLSGRIGKSCVRTDREPLSRKPISLGLGELVIVDEELRAVVQCLEALGRGGGVALQQMPFSDEDSRFAALVRSLGRRERRLHGSVAEKKR